MKSEDVTAPPEEPKVSGKCLSFQNKEKKKNNKTLVTCSRKITDTSVSGSLCTSVIFNGYCLAFKESQYFFLLLRKKGSKVGRSFNLF